MNATTLIGYQLDRIIYEGVKTVIYSGVRESDGTKVIVKTLKAEYPTLESIVRLRHEYKLLQNLDLEGIVKAYSLENYKNCLALVLEYFEGSSLKTLMSSYQIPMLSFLSLAIQLASAIAQLHKKHIIHKDIKPQNILINPETWQIKLIDFSIATCLEKETPTISNPNLLEGTLIYMSPEQTGRMNRAVDYRTDFYSLGVTFYELLTGIQPCCASEPLEIVHCHIAKTPVSPHKLNPEIPEAVSDIVMKLMAKTAENRYQSALGLKADLEICFNQLQAKGKIENFTPGQLDKSGQFLIPQKLYGRDRDVRALMEAFERISGMAVENPSLSPAPSSEIMLVSGYSGIGKSCLVNEVHKPIVAARGYFISGKFDQFKRNIPYAAFIQAFSELIRQLLTETSVNIDDWKEKLLEAFGENSQVIVDVIPEVEKIIGKQPAAIKLGPAEAQNRFNRIFLRFIQVFARAEHPLVIFLDDLQWADSASLKLIELLMTEAESNYLLLIGAYRDNEVSPTHGTIVAIEKIKQAGVVVNNIVLQPLDLEHVCELVADTVGEKRAETRNFASLQRETRNFASLLFNKTGGNPFFLTQMLSTLYQENLLTFDFNEGRWLWNIDKIQAIGITDYNVVELVARNIQKLPEATQQVLKLAACIGNRFNLDVLAIVNEKSMLEIAEALWDALQSGLVLPLSDAYKIPMIMGNELASDRERSSPLPISNSQSSISYKFLHDRVQQAAYSLIPEARKKSTHLSIGKLLLKKTAKIALEENIFDIVNQLNIGVEFIAEQSEKDELAGLNLMAGKKAIASNAPVAAVRYLNVGLQVLATNSWQTHYDLTLALHLETVAAEYLSTNYETGALLSEEVLKRAKTLLEKVPVYEAKILFYISQNQLKEAIATALLVLKMLSFPLPEKPNNLHVIVSLLQTKFALGRKPISDLIDRPELTDPYKLAALRILKAVAAPAFIANPTLGFLAILTMVKLSIKYGNSPLAAFGYVFYGMILCGPLGDIESGYQFGQLAWKIVDKFEANALKAKVSSMLYGYIIPWKKHAKEIIEPLRSAVQIGLETGDIEYAGYSALSYCTSLLLSGEHLDSVAHKYAQYIALTQQIKQEFAIGYQKIWRQMVLNLQGLADDNYRLIGESFNEEVALPDLIQSNNGTSLFAVYLAKTILCYFLKEGDLAVENAEIAAKYAATSGGVMLPAEFNFYYSLAMLAKIRNADGATLDKQQKKQYLKQVASHQKQLKKWASRAPENFQHKYDLVEAVRREVLGQDDRAALLYDRAIQGAREQQYIHEEALACERAAEFYLDKGREKIAKTYLTDAYYGYIRWGAKSKVSDLEARYPDLFARLFAKEPIGIDLTRTTTSTTGNISAALDLVTVMKASQALGEEIYLDKLLDKLMQILIENAGARKGLLFLRAKTSAGNEAGKLLLVAEGCVEKEKVVVMPSVPIEERPDLPVTIVNYVERTRETVVLNDATVEGIFKKDAYIRRTQPKSILGCPLIYQGKLTGILYLENNLTAGTFTQQRLEVLKLLCASAASALENASLYQELQTSYSELESKNTALQESESRERLKAEQLEQSLHKLQQTQAQLVQTEKISSLGQLVAGVAHEVNNPVNYISGNLRYAKQYVEDLVKHLELYQQVYPNFSTEIAEHAEAIELDYLIEDLPKMLTSMHLGTDRIRDIMQSLRNFSRVDEGAKKPADLHSGIDSTLMILSSRLKGKGDRKAIQVVKEYGNLPEVTCYGGLLNQVFMNLMANAIDAIDEGNRLSVMAHREENINNPLPIPNYPLPTLCIRTEVVDSHNVAIRIKDNGPGMSEEVRAKLFSPFFTTKPVGKGTGLGLSISHQIVVEKHQGSLQCISAPGQGTEFIIEIPIRAMGQEDCDSLRDSSASRASSSLPQISA